LMKELLDVGIATRRGVMAIHMEPFYRNRYPDLRLPVTQSATRDTLLLPMYATMTSIEQEYVVEHLLRALDACRPSTRQSQTACDARSAALPVPQTRSGSMDGLRDAL